MYAICFTWNSFTISQLTTCLPNVLCLRHIFVTSDCVSSYYRAFLACFTHLPTYQGLRIPYSPVLHDKMDWRGSQRKKNMELNSGRRK